MDATIEEGKWEGCSIRDLTFADLNWIARRSRPSETDKTSVLAEIRRRMENKRIRRAYERKRFNSRRKFRAE